MVVMDGFSKENNRPKPAGVVKPGAPAVPRGVRPELTEEIAPTSRDSYLSRRNEKKVLPKGIIWGIAGLALIFVVSFGYFLYRSASVRLSTEAARSIDQFQDGIKDLKNFDARSAAEKFASVNNSPVSLPGILSKFQALFGGVGGLAGGFQRIAGTGAKLAREAVFFEENFFQYLMRGKGPDIIAHLETTQNLLGDLQSESDAFSAGISDLEKISPDTSASFTKNYLPLRIDAANLQKLLIAFTGWLASDTPHHVLVMLQNPSEMRPGGGFLGSYADVVIYKANIIGVDVRDIADVDVAFKENIIPPKPLQAQIKRFRPADANWFFDFSRSGAEVMRFMEASKLYSASSTKFDAAIAISPKIIQDILSATGPINLPEARVTVTAEDFLTTIQAKVQAGQAQDATYPKMILRELSSALFTSLSSAGDAKNPNLFAFMGDWLDKRDIMAYFKDTGIESSLDGYGVTGKIYEPASNFNGDYLAIVDANINGGKSDLFVGQDVTFTSQINASGTVTDHLVIDRVHNGNKRKEWWYKTPNQDYLQVFVPDPSTLINFTGGFDKKITPPVNYEKNGYTTDPFVAEIESSAQKVFNYPAVSTHRDGGMQVFSTWSKINPGEKTRIVFDYSHRLFSGIADGTQYQFVFEKQAGTKRNYTFDISAPVGFRFRENGLPVYEYKSDDPPGRLLINLTLEKI
ncbi:MAG: DUF4012 domain-containing protein [Candidatus Liptonbacteria bacterium]|nr:DUF4012 domain-containing protein [Candidatus Liptonbacteria bacterium]